MYSGVAYKTESSTASDYQRLGHLKPEFTEDRWPRWVTMLAVIMGCVATAVVTWYVCV